MFNDELFLKLTSIQNGDTDQLLKVLAQEVGHDHPIQTTPMFFKYRGVLIEQMHETTRILETLSSEEPGTGNLQSCKTMDKYIRILCRQISELADLQTKVAMQKIEELYPGLA